MRALLIMLAALPLLAAGDHLGLRGKILDGQGAELSKAIVTVTTPAGFIASSVTNKSGEFSFASLPEGQYDFRVTAHGFAIVERQVTVSANGGLRELDIRMLVPAGKQTVSVSELMNPAVTQSLSRDSRGY